MIVASPIERWRALAREIVPAEVADPPRFAKTERLVEHVEKHVLKARDERWHRVVAHEVLSEARVEHRTLGWGPRCDRLAVDYEGLVAAILVERCREGADHAHHLTVRHPEAETVTEAVFEETVYAWDLETRILAIATRRIRSAKASAAADIVPTSVVSPVGGTPYRILTGYRFRADRTEAGFRKEIRRKLDDLETLGRARLRLWTVTHEEPAAHDSPGWPTEHSP